MVPDFDVDVRRDGSALVVTPIGELDISTVEQVRSRVAERAANEDLVLDLGQLGFLDTSGVQLVVECFRAARSDGFTLTILRGEPTVHRVFEIAGLEGVLPFADALGGDDAR